MDIYKEFWSEIRKKVQFTTNLYIQKKASRAGYFLKYDIQPIVSEKVISNFEKQHQIMLPKAYRTYLKHIGENTPMLKRIQTYFYSLIGHAGKDYLCAGPSAGLYKFPSKFLLPPEVDKNIAKDSKLVSFKGCDCDIDENHPIHNLNGMIRIGTSGNPTDYFMVVTGKELGRVYAWNYDDILCDEGLFDIWYQKWIDDALLLLMAT